MATFRKMLRNVFVDIDGIMVDNGNKKMRSKQVLRFYGKGRGKGFVSILKDGKGKHVVECVEI